MTTTAATVRRDTALDVSCAGLVQIYPAEDGTDVVALRNVDLDLAAGTRTALLGPSGSGKSTLVNLLAGLLRPTAGVLCVGESDLTAMTERDLRAYRAEKVGTLLQGAARNLLPFAGAVDNIAFARLARRPLGRLSGGEQQRVALAVAMANQPGILLADEPTSQVGRDHRDGILDGMIELNRRYGTTLVVVTHDGQVATRLGRTVTIRDGRVGAVGHGDEDFAVVARDGSVQLPPAVRRRWPVGTLLTVDDDGTQLRLRPRRPPGTGEQ